MAPKRTGLGRGIGALIPTATDQQDRPVDVFFPTGGSPASAPTADDLVAVPGARLANLNPLDVIPNAQQPRKEFREEELQELVHSIREIGVLQPIVVRPIPGATGTEPQYELIMGERRLRATKELGLSTIPAIVKDTPDDAMLRDALLENLHRAQLNPLEEASAYQQLLADFGITQEQLGQRIGRSRPQITNTIRLLRLPSPVQRRVAAGVLSAGHARAILAAPDAEAMEYLAEKIVNEDLSVRAAEAIAQQLSAKTPPAKPKVEPSKRQAHFNDLAERLGDRLNTRVKIAVGARKSSVTIDFANGDDLNRILGELGVQDLEG
ncbi:MULTISPECIES: ParB/RepB/Spo0J family partition protein [Curtobacterium]|jgi:ParB family chromosome partitioning protein|uniref:ParB/RepB/Spo0J family partition protein n=1 Tax=Curtobacterium TaxID=2034 RepID=UPI001BE09643|nr:ParB/RepB/Spo0J family partition protein [Curtobacterium flaccumfaciens]MBT1583411.1 ParB/RepB/Spo0J family partition protein [Curtobacterium flaccumfaciens pv. flaccumfaciens]MCS5495377.1 ParB/RepB/Spo0J family partition protein [Curtobacterium flaccumfaciens pv. flaccumfaciens]MCX2797974.1 ParB/RepB/Spo0J family partition protein [Curtobacterium flaccumfaciens pv. flaccumfaciens]UWD82643.1 ParB/RepB/Spo0J family partition protein [Curtobacterium flaccumfaciens]